MSKKKKEVMVDNSTVVKLNGKNVIFDEYLDLKSNQMAPATEQTMERMGAKLYIWATENKAALRIHQFCTQEGISLVTLWRWREKSRAFDSYYKEALLAIADRRETGAITRKYDPSFIARSMQFYDPEWKDAEERRLKGVEEHGGTKIVVIEKFEDNK